MTGAVNWETLIWLATVLVGAITGAVSMVIFAGKVLRQRDVALSQLRTDLELQIEAVDERAKLAETGINATFATLQLHFAETYATKSGTTQAVERVEEAVGDLSGKMEKGFERISNRIDKLFEGGKPTVRGG
jgi:hypothetical protein